MWSMGWGPALPLSSADGFPVGTGIPGPPPGWHRCCTAQASTFSLVLWHGGRTGKTCLLLGQSTPSPPRHHRLSGGWALQAGEALQVQGCSCAWPCSSPGRAGSGAHPETRGLPHTPSAQHFAGHML